MLEIRKATTEDLPAIMKIYAIAQDFMIATGNPDQWARRYPDEAIVRDDIDREECHVLCDEEGIRGVFVICRGIEPTYLHIENGQWINEEPYVAIHRVASDGTARDIVGTLIRYCKERHKNIRIDTHRDNQIMQHQIEKYGFSKRGIVYMEDGSPRIAYQWV